MEFREDIFLRALTERPEDARRFSQLFHPEWLQTAAYRPILAKIYEFTRQKNTPPNLRVLRQILEKEDDAAYENRHKGTLDKIEQIDPLPEVSEIIYTLDLAKNVAISWSFKEMVQSPAFMTMNDDFDGEGQVKAIQGWLKQFEGSSEDIELDIKEAVERLIRARGFDNFNSMIPCHVEIIDEWCGGGLRPGNLGIMLAPTGHGKSVFLATVAHKVAATEQKRVLFITNELTMEEQTERFLSRITGEKLSRIIDDPVVGYSGLDRHWQGGLNDNLRLVEVMREISTNDIEGMVGRYINLLGWAPEVVVIDFMERMKPVDSGYRRDQSWNWLGAVAKDLVRMAKKNRWIVWSAAQTNRAGYNTLMEQNLSHAQGSVQHLQEATLVASMRKRQTDAITMRNDDAILLEFRPLKTRHSRGEDHSVLIEAVLGEMRITNDRHDLQELAAQVTFDDDDDEEKETPRDKQQRAQRKKRWQERD